MAATGKWIISKTESGGTTIVIALDYTDVQSVESTAKLVSGNLKRTFTFIFKDGSQYVLPDDAVVVSGPAEYYELMAAISREIQV